jgi:dipeptidase E
MSARRRILALGGHEFDRRDGNGAICDLIVELAGPPQPRICLLPTASGDPEDQITRFRRAFADRGCVPSVISLFRLGNRPMDLRTALLTQDAIYVGGGSLVNLVAIWRAHGLDGLLRDCWREGILLCGQSAGAMCWFEGGITSSSGKLMVGEGLGLISGSACVHYLTEPLRRRELFRAVARGELPGGLGLENQTGALFADNELAEVFSARAGATVWRVTASGDGARETSLPARRLRESPSSAGPEAEILELRQTIAAREASRRGRGRGPARLG